MLNVMAAAALALSVVVSPTSVDTTAAPPDQLTVEILTVNGSGCPAGTAAVAAAADKTAFTVTYSSFLAQVGVGASPTDFRKNCQLAIRVFYPQGFTYGIAQADHRGFGHLVRGATALQRANYYFQGTSATTHSSHSFAGPLSDNWQATDKTDVASIVYAPCGELRNFNINSELRVSAGSSNPATTTSFMSMDSTDGSVSTKFHFAWKRC